MKNIQNRLFFVTILVFLIGMINISLTLFAFVCFITPFVLYFKTGEPFWCKYICPRAGMFTRLLGKISLKKKMPSILRSDGAKQFVIGYFIVNMIIMIVTTVMVGMGRISSLEHVRFLMFFRVPFELPQLLSLTVTDTITHLGYRVYSMMLTTVSIGLVLGILYAPRTWCVICPIQNLTKKSNING